MINSHNYEKAIKEMVCQTELDGNVPNMYSDSYKDVVIAALMKEKEYCITSRAYGYLQFNCLVDLFRENGEIFDMISNYMNCEWVELKPKIAIKIADSLVKSAYLYYREDIEDDVNTLHRRGFCGRSD